MILPRHDIAWFDTGDRTEPFDADRLVRSIRRAAACAGHHDWWLAESIAAAVHLFACENKDDRTVTAREVSDIVASLLSMLSFNDIARAYSGRQQHAEIWLDEVVARAGGGFELSFYRQLDAALGVASHREMETLRVLGLRGCVMQLRGDRRWSAGCRRLADEIVGYVRERVTRARPARAASLNLAVVE